ncbi:unnamed protein product [Leptidea sinapis]|uniref:Uncharacterized protein n=1 Tax=Leptidea sinapis TaxID=189913 RepID=A0A5E4PVJ4_9NEOP|nr:unnamed protein product [Leptidea sinapis]
MSEESERHGESTSDGGATNVARVLLTPQQLENATLESLRASWKNQDLYIDQLESLNKQLEGIYETIRTAW